MLDFSLTEAQLALKLEIVAFAQQNLNEGVKSREKAQCFDVDLWQRCSEIGLLGLCLPEQYGGKGQGPLSTILALEALGYGCVDNGLNLAISAHLLACAVPILEFGNEVQKQTLLPDLCSGNKIAANAISEPQSGSDVFSMSSTAFKTGNGYTINGHKCSITNAPVADMLLMYAANDVQKGYLGGVTAFILEKHRHPYNVSGPVDKVGLRTAAMGDIECTDVFVETEQIVGKVGIGGPIFSRSMEWERIGLGACHLGTMQRLLEQVVSFCKARKSSGQAIAKYQAVSHQIADLKTQLEAARLMIYHSAWKLEQKQHVSTDASMAKLFVSETFKEMTIKLMQIYAGSGFRCDNDLDIERMLRDSLAATLYSGTSEVQRNLIAMGMNL